MPLIKNTVNNRNSPSAPLIIPKNEIKEEPEDDDVIITNYEPYRYVAPRTSSEFRRRGSNDNWIQNSHNHTKNHHQNQNFYDHNDGYNQNSHTSTSEQYRCSSSRAPTLNERFGGAPRCQFQQNSFGIRSDLPIRNNFYSPRRTEENAFYDRSPEYANKSNVADHKLHNCIQNDVSRYRLSMTPPSHQEWYPLESSPFESSGRREPRFSEHGFELSLDDPSPGYSPPRPHRKRRKSSGFEDYGYRESRPQRRQDYPTRRRCPHFSRSPSPPPVHSSRKRRGSPKPLPYIKQKRHEIPIDDYSNDDSEIVILPPKIVHPIPKSAVKSISENLLLITELTNCQLELLPDLLAYMEYQNVELKGTVEQIADARERLDEWILTDQEYRQRDKDVVHSILYVPVPEDIRNVICRRRELKKIENYSGVLSIEVAKSCEEFPPVCIRGTLDDVISAKTKLQRCIEKRHKETEGRVEERLKIPKSCVGKVMGRGGETVAMMRKSTDVVRSSLLPDMSGDYRIMEVVGTAEQVKQFKDKVQEIIGGTLSRNAPEDTDEGVFRIELRPEQVGRLIGRHGRIIREIRERSRAKVMIDEEVVTVSGNKIEADYARHLIYQQIGEIDESVPYEDMSHYNNLSKVKPPIRTRSGKVLSIRTPPSTSE